ncbi:hypothetical protein HanPI659440_Chr16g0652911 [Helianthus annuus]|nr:hypothetical protein HanPI659440_Chr16g0652911 [Helianthus annuus]
MKCKGPCLSSIQPAEDAPRDLNLGACLYTRSLSMSFFFFFLNGKFWITDGSLEYHRATSGTTRSYPSRLGIIHIHQFRRKPNKYEKTPFVGIEPRTY